MQFKLKLGVGVKSKRKKIFFSAIVAFVFIFGGIGFAMAAGEPTFIEKIGLGAVATFAGFVGYVMGFIAGALFWLIGLFATLALTMNQGITSSAIVKTGSDIILNITNLGFVLSIIIIAFATILQFENYAIKKTLWKLIVAALIVNFSLTIAGAFIGVANQATQFMMEKSGANNPFQWATAFANMFQVQRLITLDNKYSEDGGKLSGLLTDMFASTLTYIASLIFGAIFTFIAAITFSTVVIMLFIRYVYLSMLLIFSPIIWLAWIFPATHGYWSDWWKKFIRWTFFAPIMMFFMYLAMITMSSLSAPVNSAIRGFTGKTAFIAIPLDAISQMIIVVGLIIGGMMAANKLGMEFADKIYNTSSQYSKGWAYRGGQRVMSSEIMMGSKEKGTSGLVGRLAQSNVPGTGLLARGLNRLGANTEKGAAAAMSNYRGYIKGLSKDRITAEILGGTPGRTRNVAIEEAIKNKKLDNKIFEQLLTNPDELGSLEKGFKSQNLNFSDVTKAIGADSKILGLAKAGNFDDLIKEQSKFFEKTSPDDIAKSFLAKQLYKKDAKFKDAVGGDDVIKTLKGTFTDSLIKSNRFGSIYKILPNLSGEEIEEIKGYVDNSIEKVKSKGGGKIDVEKLEKAFNKALGKRLYGEPEEDKNEEDKGAGDKGGDDKGGGGKGGGKK